MDDNYEMVPYKDILELKNDIASLKQGTNLELQGTVRQLSSQVGELSAIFKEAGKAMFRLLCSITVY